MWLVTLDTNILPASDLIEKARGKPFAFARISVTDREIEGTSFRVHIVGTQRLLETGVYDESRWDDAVWADEASPLEEILRVISNGSFPPERSSLSAGERKQLRDAMILEAHIREKRNIFVSNDERAFLKHGKREVLENRFHTEILTRIEFEKKLAACDCRTA